MNKTRLLFTVFLTVLLSTTQLFVVAQEGLKPLSSNLGLVYPVLLPQTQFLKTSPVAQKAGSLLLPFLDDFYYADQTVVPDQSLWEGKQVFVNQGFPINPPSIGVATFDGLGEHGYPYNISTAPNLNLSVAADTLTSRAINLFMGAQSQTFTPNDSIGISFYYQARGYGEAPEAPDSLLLDFYSPFDTTWYNVWGTKGNTNPNTVDTVFKRAFVMIKDTAFFHDGFKFRFRNKATTSGNFDHWHLDYVYLNSARNTIADTWYNDVTFGYVPTSFLKNYRAMPYTQYVPDEMADNNWVALKNNYKNAINIFYENKFYKSTQQVYFYSSQANNIPPYATNGYYSNPAFSNPVSHPSFTFSYPAGMTAPTVYTIKHYIYENNNSKDFIPDNDTVYQFQHFDNYFACDDGGAEAGYYVLGVAGEMAQRFKMNNKELLRALQIYFDPAPLGSAGKFYFKIKIYSGSVVPENLVYSSDSLYYPNFFNHGFKELTEYQLKSPIELDPGTYFIAIQQQLSTGLVVGFDRNTASNGAVVYNSGNGWKTSEFKGALLMRPVVGQLVQGPQSLTKQSTLDLFVSVYPNPANQFVSITNNTETLLRYQLFDQLGKQVLAGELESQNTFIDCAELSAGIYLLNISDNGHQTIHKKLVIAK